MWGDNERPAPEHDSGIHTFGHEHRVLTPASCAATSEPGIAPPIKERAGLFDGQ
jgi:hypothetical protein